MYNTPGMAGRDAGPGGHAIKKGLPQAARDLMRLLRRRQGFKAGLKDSIRVCCKGRAGDVAMPGFGRPHPMTRKRAVRERGKMPHAASTCWIATKMGDQYILTVRRF
jgi:hypothetical protein